MSRVNMFNLSAVMLSCFVGMWTGVKFFEPIIVERLRKDGGLRQDMQFPEYDEDGEVILPDGVEKPDILKLLSGEQTLEQTTYPLPNNGTNNTTEQNPVTIEKK